ncbi:MAG: tetratricopeptide repeat protein [Prevotella sp.]|nr:tetratricopeptide repeat protein [Prevotella sp.]
MEKKNGQKGQSAQGQTQTQTGAVTSLLERHRTSVIIVVVLVVAVIAGLFLYRSYYAAPREDRASTALAKAQDLFAAEDSTALASFLAVASDYRGTKAANLASLYAGLCYAKDEKWADAVKYLEKFSAKGDAMISPAATAALANAYANTGNIDKAVATLKKAVKMADRQALDGVNYSLSPLFLVQAAQLLESQGKNDEALTIYKDIRAKYINSQPVQSKEIDKYIQRLEEKR